APAKRKKPKLLNKFDKTIKAEIDAAEKLRKKGKLEEALRAFEALVQLHPQSPRARYGKAQVPPLGPSGRCPVLTPRPHAPSSDGGRPG
ncbi:unnamed protein product, partial [Tetraodon nigroviridis]